MHEVFIGSSNTILYWMNFANFLSPGAIHPIRDSVSLGMFHMADIIIESGEVVYQNATRCAYFSGAVNASCLLSGTRLGNIQKSGNTWIHHGYFGTRIFTYGEGQGCYK